MHSTDYQTETNDNGPVIYTTEQWFRAIQVRKMEYDRNAKPKSNSSENSVLGNDFVIHRWLHKILLSKIKTNSENLEIKPKKFKCIECNNKFDTYLENCLACGANILKSEDIQKQATYLMLIILSASSLGAILYFVETGPIKIFSAAFGLLAVAKLVKLFRLDWDR